MAVHWFIAYIVATANEYHVQRFSRLVFPIHFHHLRLIKANFSFYSFPAHMLTLRIGWPLSFWHVIYSLMQSNSTKWLKVLQIFGSFFKSTSIRFQRENENPIRTEAYTHALSFSCNDLNQNWISFIFSASEMIIVTAPNFICIPT